MTKRGNKKRTNNKYRDSGRRKVVVVESVIILLLAGLAATGIYFHADEKLLGRTETATDMSADEADATGPVEQSEEEGKVLSAGESVDEGRASSTEEQPEDAKKDPLAEDHPNEENEPLPEDTTIVFTGDVELSSYVQQNYDASGIEGVVSETLRRELVDADILEINNEFCFSTRGTQAPDKQYTFRVNPSYVSVLTDLGADVAGLANNHVLDYGKEALTDTFATLNDAGIQYTGAGDSVSDASKLVVIEKNGLKFGFLAASRVIPVASWNVENSQPGVFTCYDTTALINAISEARPKVDYLFVCVHWGTEHTDVLTDYQMPNAHAYIDAGADAVIGAHSHCLQGIEYYNGKPIFYSLGNFIFNQSISSTMAVKFTIPADPNEDMTVTLLPASASSATTSLATGEKAASIFDYLEGISPTISLDENGIVTKGKE